MADLEKAIRKRLEELWNVPLPGGDKRGSCSAVNDFSAGEKVTRRILLRDDVDFAEVRRFVESKNGMEIFSSWLDEAEALQYRTIWNVGDGLSLWHTKDNIVGCSYVQVAGVDMNSADRLLAEVEDYLPVFSRNELLSSVDDSFDSIALGISLMRLGVTGSVGFDSEIHDVISAEFYSEYEEVRDMAVWAASYAPYLEYLPDLEEVRENDPSEKVRRRAELVIQIYRQLGVDEG